MPTVHLGLGSNVGDRLAALRAALARLSELGPVEAVSSVYETAPVGVLDQPPFLNACATIATELSPREVLSRARDAERALGRAERRRWGPREIDVDVLLFGDLRVAEADLVVPHPRMTERAFVLVPLAEIAGGAVVPGTGATVAALLERLPRTAGDVVRVAPPSALRGPDATDARRPP